MAPLMEERAINEVGKEVIMPSTATSNLMLVEFDRQLEPVAERPTPPCKITHSALQHELGDDQVRYMVDDDQCSKTLNNKIPQMPTRAARLHVESIKNHEVPDLHVVISQSVHMIPTHEKAKIHLGVSITPPLGTVVHSVP